MAAPQDASKDSKRLKRMAEGIDLPEDELKRMQIEMQIDLGIDLDKPADELDAIARQQQLEHDREIQAMLETTRDKPQYERERIQEELDKTSPDKNPFESAARVKAREPEPEEPAEAEEAKESAPAAPVDRTPVDSRVSLTVTPDEMHAFLSITVPQNGGRKPSVKVLEEYLRRKGVVSGVDRKNLQLAVDEVCTKERQVTDFEVATGKPAEEGEDAEIIRKFEAADPSQFAGTIDMDGVAALGRAVKGQPILQLKPAIAGRSGATVTGHELKAADVKSLQIETRRNTKRAGDCIVPEIDGLVYLFPDAVIVKPYADGEVQIETDEDRMNAFVNLLPAVGDGRKLTMEDVMAKLAADKIQAGINEKILADAVAKCENDKIPLARLPVAKGKQPVHGPDAKIVFRIRMQNAQNMRENEKGNVDFREKDSIINIDQGTLIAVLFPPQKKVSDGITVTGEVLPGRDGNPVSIRLGKNIETRPGENGLTEYYAGISGQIVFADSLLEVEPLFIVEKNVDLTVGNIDFVGNVLIKGNVNDDFTVKSGGDIEVRGSVNAAHLTAGRDIYVKGGVMARSAGGLRAGNNVVARFAENASIIANNTVTIERAAMHSEIAAGNAIVCTKEKGQIIGGHTIAKNRIEVKELGAPAGAKTEVTIGMDFFQMEKLNRLTEELQKFIRAQEKIDGVVEKMEKARGAGGTLPAELEASYNDLLQKKLLVQRKLHEIRKQKMGVLLEVEDNVGGELVVLGTLYTDVKINLGKNSIETHEQRDRQHAHADPATGKLMIEPYVPQTPTGATAKK